jgi:tetratricopeptide (TPR) repeat protein
MLGTAYYEQGRLAEAIQQYRTALQVKSPPARTHWCLGLALEKQGKLDEAASEYLAALAIEPTHAGALKSLQELEARPDYPKTPAPAASQPQAWAGSHQRRC